MPSLLLHRMLCFVLLGAAYAALSGCATASIKGGGAASDVNTILNRLPPEKRTKVTFRRFDRGSILTSIPVSEHFEISSKVFDSFKTSHCPFGNPTERENIDFGPTELVWREGYDLLHSADLKTPYWVCETYTSDSLQANFERGSTNFKADPNLQLARAEPSDYAGSSQYTVDNEPFPIDIGHMAPAEAHSSTMELLTDTFYFSNAVPQHRSMNRGQWAKLEACARASAPASGTAWVISGPMIHSNADVERIRKLTIGNQVVVPTHTWKIFVSQKSDDSISTWAAVMPNQKLPAGSELNDFAASIDDIEDATGFDFMPELSEEEQSDLESTSHTIPCR